MNKQKYPENTYHHDLMIYTYIHIYLSIFHTLYVTYRYGGPRHRNDCERRKNAYKKETMKTNSPTCNLR